MGSISYSIDKYADTKTEVLNYLRSVLPEGSSIVDYNFGPGDGDRRLSFGWGGVLYAAVRDANGSVVMWLAEYKLWKESGWRTLCVRLQDETMGSARYDAARRVMNHLTPTDHKYANQWRADVANHQDAKRAAARRGRDAIGKVIRLPFPLTYSVGGAPIEISEALVVDARTWTDPATGYRLRPPTSWNRLNFTIIGTAPHPQAS